MKEIKTVIDEISFAKTKTGKDFVKLKAGGQNYSVWPDAKAYDGFQKGEFGQGDTVNLKFTENKQGNILYKNVDEIELVSKSEVVTKVVREADPVDAEAKRKYWEAKERRMIRMNGLRHAVGIVTPGIVAEEKPDFKEYADLAIEISRKFEARVYEGYEEKEEK